VPVAGDDVYSNSNIVTINVDVTVNSINNSSYSTPEAIPLMTSNTTPSGIASNFAAFDRNSNTDWINSIVSPGISVSYEFPTPKVIDQYYFAGYSNQNNWSFEAWDGSTWIVLHTVTGANTGTYTSPLIGNSTSYIKYRFVLNDSGYRRIHGVGMYEAGTVGTATAGGQFIINDGRTVTAQTFNYSNASSNYNALFVHTGTGGTTTLSGSTPTAFTQRVFLSITGTGTFNYVGILRGLPQNETRLVNSTHTGTINFTGDIYWDSGNAGANNSALMDFSGSSFNLTITGNIYHQSIATAASYSNTVLRVAGGNSVTIIGNVNNQTINMSNWTYPSQTIVSSMRTTIIGSLINQSSLGTCLACSSDLCFLSGPFQSSVYGMLPYDVKRVFLIPTNNTYFEFRSNNTLGVVPPYATPTAVRLYSPDAAADAPIAANVRTGIVYLDGNLTGTMAIPSASSVTAGVLVDNTIGTAALDPSAIWAVPLTSINTLNSIGRRVKNAATVETTGAQIQTTLNNNP
jgi:hypothetical protein